MKTKEYDMIIFTLRLITILLFMNIMLLIYTWQDHCASVYNSFLQDKVEELNCERLITIIQEVRSVEHPI